ncbi:transcriptional regulator [[Haemophilus] ducreyi]|uniref:Transcriptional regulator n=1 Tax=Haemophilus ducreyi TaxID=730 RepID=A0AAC9ENB6_HAEDC|nr:transcriptional regulator [[Haemophilus] ducreyi]AKO33027.1 transcriptional regulator [[Haemophilus] ducreyi]AKO34474.1 transcriptional regulator [[Haemophilus] ducreyi]AKO35913.1 transcriptional regulator [[Haemophilus] ducreyi]AKO37371.1 transcriptional regulator [[Haemophilus] ducreyi]
MGNRIRDEREKAGRSRNELADTLGLSLSTLQLWETNEREPQASMIITIAEELGVSPSYLLTGETEEGEVKTPVAKTQPTQQIQDISMINSFETISVSAGFGSFNEGVTEPDGQVPYDDELLRKLGVKPRHCAVFWASGNSMQPTIDNGDQLLVDLDRKDIKSDSVYLVQNGTSVWVKRVKVRWNSVELISDNKEEYDPIILTTTDAENLQVIGQVVHIGKILI